MTPADWTGILGGAAGVAGFLLAAWIAYQNVLRRSVMTVRLLAPPTSYSLFLARRGSTWASHGVEIGDLVVLTGTLPGVVTNDGPRGGAVWG